MRGLMRGTGRHAKSALTSAFVRRFRREGAPTSLLSYEPPCSVCSILFSLPVCTRVGVRAQYGTTVPPERRATLHRLSSSLSSSEDNVFAAATAISGR